MELLFVGVPRFFIGRVTIEGVRNERLSSLLEFGTNLDPGRAFMRSLIPAATDGVKDILQQNGFYEPNINVKTESDPVGNQINVTYTVDPGPQARVGQVTLEGDDLGLTLQEFLKKSRLRTNSRVTRDTTSNALSRLRTGFQKRDRLEATVTLQKQTYNEERKQVDFDFHGVLAKGRIGADVDRRRPAYAPHEPAAGIHSRSGEQGVDGVEVRSADTQLRPAARAVASSR